MVGKSHRDSSLGSAAAEDRQAGRQATIEVAAGGALPTGMVAERGRRGAAAATVASVPLGSPAHQGEESARRYRQERRSGWPANRDTERAPATGSLAAVRLVPATALGSVRVVGPAGGAHRPLEPSGAASGRRTSRRPTLDDASGSRSGGGISLRVGDRGLAALPARQIRSQLSRTDSRRRFQFEQATPGSYHQARQFAGALAAGRSRYQGTTM